MKSDDDDSIFVSFIWYDSSKHKKREKGEETLTIIINKYYDIAHDRMSQKITTIFFKKRIFMAKEAIRKVH